ncbi:receptor-type tyrosine-protein phosphatase F-like [Apostichopus japonicus]|uniref:receptor-type tyrosine-protein phosphatase F-like n=1 Tax=Stichopus japonicus TaxID=307972 RepID=UPI003AB392D3
MEGYFLIQVLLLSSVCLLTNCCLLSKSGACAMQNSFYGGRLTLVDEGDLRQGSAPPWANQRLFVFKMPPSFFKGGHYHSKFGHRGFVRIWMPEEAPCSGDRSQHVFPSEITEQAFCLDSSLPCYQTPPSYDQSEPLEFSNITSAGITVTWPAWDETVDHGHGPIVEYRIQIKGPGEEKFTEIPKGRQLSHQFTGLRENADYKFRISVIRDHPFGEGTPSNEQTGRTSGAPLYANPEPLEFKDVTSSGITVTWPAWDPIFDTGTGPVTGYMIMYREEGHITWTSKETESLSVQLTDLTEETAYEVAIKLKYKQGNYTEQSTTQMVHTSLAEPPSFANPEPLEFRDVTSSSVTVSWPEWDPRADSGTGPVTRYKIYYRQEGNGEWKTEETSGTFVSLTELTDGTAYEVAVSLEDRNGDYTNASVAQIATTACEDLVITDLNYTSLSKRVGYARAIVMWSVEGVTDSCRVLSQSLSFRLLDILECGGVPPTVDVKPRVVHVEDGEARKRTVIHLKANSLYNLTLRLNTQTGTNKRSLSIQTVTTRPTGEPTNLESEMNNSDMVFRWNKPKCSKRNGPINSYHYTVATFMPNATNPAPVIAEHTEDNKIRLREDDPRIWPNEQYVFTVRATTGTGSGVLSSPTTDMQFVFESQHGAITDIMVSVT